MADPEPQPADPAWLLADIGGTNARFALAGRRTKPHDIRVLSNRDHPDIGRAAAAYLAQVQPATPPRMAAFCVACPTDGDEIALTNYGWRFSKSALGAELDLDRLEVINDFAAVAHCVPYLADADREQIGGGPAVDGAPIGVIGPGTGLGVSGLVQVAGHWIALASEGGHVSLAACNTREDAVLQALRQQFGRVSSERAVSGPGLLNLYWALCSIDGVAAQELTPGDVTARALAGDETCSEAARMLSAMLGTVAGNLALTLGARGGVYVAGGVVGNMGAAFDRALFRARFEDKGRLTDFNNLIPVFLITATYPAFLGLAELLREPADAG